MSDPNLPIALRPAVDFPPVRGSIFDDPGDEKSWHVSQRSESLYRFYEGRDPSWYMSAIAPLAGADRVIDLGCGPGLTLKALLDQGCSSVLGVDRWPAFADSSTPEAPIIAHDLTLPMPFLASGSFDGVLSHYALDYLSPIGMRQVMREAHRLLTPGGRLLIYVAAVGLGSGDEARTAAYSPLALQALLAEADFDEIDVEASPNGRNSVVRARRGAGDGEAYRQGHGVAQASIEGDTQLSVSFRTGDNRVGCTLSGAGEESGLMVELDVGKELEASPVSVCAQVRPLASRKTELQAWVWRGFEPVASECVRFDFAATDLRIACVGDIEHVSSWSPSELSIEPPGSAYVRCAEVPPASGLSEAERGAEGRRILIEPVAGEVTETEDWISPGRNRFLLKRAAGVDPQVIEHEWQAGRAHGIVVMAEEFDGKRMRDLLLWAFQRQALVALTGPAWDSILSTLSRWKDDFCCPVALVDPAVGDNQEAQPVPAEVVAAVEDSDRFFVVLGSASRECSADHDLRRLSRHLLHGGPDRTGNLGTGEETETLRYLTERTMLMRMRQVYGRSPAEVGRRAVAP